MQRSENGSVLPLFAICFTILIGFVAVSVDSGRLYVERLALLSVADAAALSGVYCLPDDPAAAMSAAFSSAEQNGIDRSSVSVEILGDSSSKLGVTVQKPVTLEFAAALNMAPQALSVTSCAETGVATSVTGAVPFGIEAGDFVDGGDYVLRVTTGGQRRGNFHALALGLPGASSYEHMLRYGYSGVLSVGDSINTEPGSMQGPTLDGVTARLEADPLATYEYHRPGSSRLMLVPVVTSFDVAGRKEIRIDGFAMVFLESVDPSSNEVFGRFVNCVVPGESSGAGIDFGARCVKLAR
jgi:Flp pilus assembly protein TadG